MGQDATSGLIDGPATSRPSEIAADVRPAASRRAARVSGPTCLLLLLLLLLALLLAGCGGSSQPTHHVTTTAALVVHRPVRGTSAGAVNDGNRSGAGSPKRRMVAASNPCALVSRSEAQAIIGGLISALVEAPQGPTCIYRPIRDKRVITLSVQSLEFARLKAQIHDLRPVTVHGRTGYCGSYGQPTVFVPLSSGRVLDVTASCSIATRIASAAVTRLYS